MMNDRQKEWSRWSYVPADAAQKSRVEKALSAEMTPLRIDHDNGSAVFVGTKGDLYNTSLSCCDCFDFSTPFEPSPCKHMYRLAMELSLFPNSGMLSDVSVTKLRFRKFQLIRFMEEAPLLSAVRIFLFISDVFARQVLKDKMPDDAIMEYCYMLDTSDEKYVRKIPKYKKDVGALSEIITRRVGSGVLNGMSRDNLLQLVAQL